MSQVPSRASRGLPLPSPQESLIRAQNAQRISRRAAAAQQFQSVVQATGVEDLGRGPRPEVGGSFERIQRVPRRRRQRQDALTSNELAQFLQFFNIDPQTDNINTSTSFSSFFGNFGGAGFGPNTFGQ